MSTTDTSRSVNIGILFRVIKMTTWKTKRVAPEKENWDEWRRNGRGAVAFHFKSPGLANFSLLNSVRDLHSV